MTHRRTKIGVALLVGLSASGFAVLGGEWALRHGIPPTTVFERWVPERGGDGPRVLVLGDSFFTRLPGRPDVHDRLLERILPSGLQVLNPSRPGIGPQDYLRLFVESVEHFTPDVVLLSHYVGNDLLDLGCWRAVDDVIAEATQPSARERVFDSSFLLSYLEALARDYAMRHPDFDWDALEARGIPAEDVERARRFEVNPWVIGMGESWPTYYRETLFVDSDCARLAWQNTVVVLDEILRRARAIGAAVVPVVFPHTLQVNDLHLALYARWQLDVDASMETATRPQDLLREYYGARGVEMLDLLPAFKDASEQLYWTHDEHLAPAGQRVAAREIADVLLEVTLPRAARP